MIYIYEVEKMKMDSFTKLDIVKSPWKMIGQFVKAALNLKNIECLKDWDGDGEYWFIELPWDDEFIVMVRPKSNPFSSGYLVSPIEIPLKNRNSLSYKSYNLNLLKTIEEKQGENRMNLSPVR